MLVNRSVSMGCFLSLVLFSCAPKKPVSAPEKTGDTGASIEEVPVSASLSIKLEQSRNQMVFAVDDVERAKELRKEFPFKEVFEDRISKEIYQVSEPDTTVDLIPARMNGFVQCVYDAYAQHRPLSISPDDVWLLIAQGFSIHANEHMEVLEEKLFVADKPDTLVVRNDSLGKSGARGWQQLLAGLSEKVGSYTQPGVYETMVPSFSTTSLTDKTVYEVALLETASKVFTYAGESGCGIPSIRLEGTTEDWEAVLSGFQKLKAYGLDEWVEGLSPALEEFIKASKGEVNKAFWQAIYKESSHYDVTYISGWIWKFFPYVRFYERQMFKDHYMESFNYEPNAFLLGDRYAECTLDSRSFPSGISKVKVLWHVHDLETGEFQETREMMVYAGFAGVEQDEDFTLSPCRAWAVCYEDAPEANPQFEGRWDGAGNMREVANWLGLVMDAPEVMPIYAPDEYANHEASMEALSTYLSQKTGEDLSGVEISFKVSWLGTVYDVAVENASENLTKKLQELLTSLPHGWSPATTKDPPVIAESPGEPFKVNCRLKL